MIDGSVHVTLRPVEKQPLVVIGIPSLGMISIPWHARFQVLQRPTNVNFTSIYEVGLPVDQARNSIVQKALAIPEMTHLLFIDDDVLLPPDAIRKLWAHRLPIVAGVYYVKAEPDEPMIYAGPGSGPMYDLPVEGLIDVWAHGMGCCLMTRDVLLRTGDAAPKTDDGTPIWYHTDRDTALDEDSSLQRTEDLYFMQLCDAAGVARKVDASIFCWHWDHRTMAAFPLSKWKAQMQLQGA
jgi:hypothetical protein